MASSNGEQLGWDFFNLWHQMASRPFTVRSVGFQARMHEQLLHSMFSQRLGPALVYTMPAGLLMLGAELAW